MDPYLFVDLFIIAFIFGPRQQNGLAVMPLTSCLQLHTYVWSLVHNRSSVWEMSIVPLFSYTPNTHVSIALEPSTNRIIAQYTRVTDALIFPHVFFPMAIEAQDIIILFFWESTCEKDWISRLSHDAMNMCGIVEETIWVHCSRFALFQLGIRRFFVSSSICMGFQWFFVLAHCRIVIHYSAHSKKVIYHLFGMRCSDVFPH